jgi:hypothetical protein
VFVGGLAALFLALAALEWRMLAARTVAVA